MTHDDLPPGRLYRALAWFMRLRDHDPTTTEVGIGAVAMIWAVVFLPLGPCMTCVANWSGMKWLPEWVWSLLFAALAAVVAIGQGRDSLPLRRAAMVFAVCLWPAVLISLLWVRLVNTSWIYLVLWSGALLALMQLRRQG